MIFTYLLQLLTIGGLVLLLFWGYYSILGVHRAKVEQRLFLAELKEKVKFTTPEKDAQLLELHNQNKKAVFIINNAIKETNIQLQSVASMEEQYDFNTRDKVLKLDRREQLNRHLELKRARRLGEIEQKTAKILEFKHKTAQK